MARMGGLVRDMAQIFEFVLESTLFLLGQG
jgi:hypothetical protein